MELKEIYDKARAKLNPVCKVCPVCNGVACRGQIPGMGGTGTGASFMNNFQGLAKHRINLHTLHDVREPNLEVEFFGQKLSMPIILGAVAGTKMNMNDSIGEYELAENLLEGASLAGVLAMTGDGNPAIRLYETGLEAVKKFPNTGIPIIKPRPQEELLELIHEAEQAGAIGVGIDIDAAALINPKIQLKVEPKTKGQLAELVKSTKLPLILKGVMTVKDAETARDAGVAGIVVSNHGGRAIDHCPGTAEVLPAIAQAVREDMAVLIDGGIRSGLDILKCLALGAHGVLLGRPPVIAAIGGGAQGVRILLETYRFELKRSCILTGSKDVNNITKDILFD